MRAALLYGYGQAYDLAEFPTPEPGPGEVLVRIAGAGACHSDLSIATGKIPIIESFPMILGHENSGYVEALGPGVSGFQQGEPVIIFGGWGCGECGFCRRGEEQACDESRWMGHGPPGGYAEFVLVPAARHLFRIGNIDPVVAAALTDAGLTPYRAVRRAAARLVPGATAVCIGVGGLGHFGLQYLKILGNALVVAVDVSESARRLGEELGADVTLDPKEVDVPLEVKGLSGGDGADVVVDFVGTDATLEMAKAMVGRFGLIMLVGLAGGTLPYVYLDFPTEVDLMTASWGNRAELSEVISLAQTGRLRPQIERHRLADINKVFTRLANGEVEGRAVLVP